MVIISIGDKGKILFSAIEFVFLVVLIAAVPAIVLMDTVIIGHGIGETSITELMQATLILLSALIFAVSAWQHPQARGCLVLVAGFFGCMFIRECDYFLDKIAHGFWFYPALLLACGAIAYALHYRHTIVSPMAAYIDEKYHTYITIGLLILLVYSRLLGTGILWREVMNEDYQSLYKSVVQEGLELLGYVLIAYGSVLFLLHAKAANSAYATTYSLRADLSAKVKYLPPGSMAPSRTARSSNQTSAGILRDHSDA